MCCDRILALNPKKAAAWYEKAFALSKLKRYKEAVECYDKAHSINPNHAETWKEKASALCELRRFEEAIGCYEKALEIDPESATAWHNRGWALSNVHRYAEALECYERALKMNPKHSNSIKNRKKVLELMAGQMAKKKEKKRGKGVEVVVRFGGKSCIVSCASGTTLDEFERSAKAKFDAKMEVFFEVFSPQLNVWVLLEDLEQLKDGGKVRMMEEMGGESADGKLAALMQKIESLELEIGRASCRERV